MDDRLAADAEGTATPSASPAAAPAPSSGDPRTATPSFVDLEERPVADHVGVFEAEHARLQGELGTIDQL